MVVLHNWAFVATHSQTGVRAPMSYYLRSDAEAARLTLKAEGWTCGPVYSLRNARGSYGCH